MKSETERHVLESFSPNWLLSFENEKEKLLNAFRGFNIQFYHIGSTAVHACAAKPIIDIIGVTSDASLVGPYSEALSELGYVAMGECGTKQRCFFWCRGKTPIYLHIYEDTDPEVERLLRFVAYLNKHPEMANEYGQIKQRLIKQFSANSELYSRGKDEFIKKIDIMAAKESSSNILAATNRPRKNSWTEKEILQAMEENFHLQMTYLAKYIQSVRVTLLPDVTVVFSELADDSFNFILSARFNEFNVDDRVSQILPMFKKSQLPFSWWVSPFDTPGTLTDVLLSKGLVTKEEDVGMHLFIDQFTPLTAVSSLTFRRVNSLPLLKDFSNVIVTMGCHPDSFDKIYSKAPLILYQDGACFEIYAAYENDTPVTTGILVLHANAAGIYYIATVPAHRKKGYGTAMMQYLIQRARDKGYHLAVLQASREGKPLYERLGFKECCVFKPLGLKG